MQQKKLKYRVSTKEFDGFVLKVNTDMKYENVFKAQYVYLKLIFSSSYEDLVQLKICTIGLHGTGFFL